MQAQQTQIKPSTTSYLIDRLYHQELIKKVLFDDSVWFASKDDGSVSRECDLPMRDEFYYLGLFVNEQLAAIMMFHPHTSVSARCHIAVLPEYRRFYSGPFALDCFEWMKKNTPYKRFVAFIPECNRLAIALAKRVKMKNHGRLMRTILKNGEYMNELIYEAE